VGERKELASGRRSLRRPEKSPKSRVLSREVKASERRGLPFIKSRHANRLDRPIQGSRGVYHRLSQCSHSLGSSIYLHNICK
jgi:hypothetical protein